MSLVGQVIVKPIITEKSLRLAKGQNKYVFAISSRASKPEIKRAVEKLFGVPSGRENPGGSQGDSYLGGGSED